MPWPPLARVLVHDSTVESLPKHLARLFPGGGNQHGGDYANLKIQWICDLKNSAVEHVSLSGFTRNDQAAAPDILEVARTGDLVLRDLGYLVTRLPPQMADRGIFFLSRHRHCVNFHDPQTGQVFDLSARLRISQTLDLSLLLGPERVPVRVVALPVPEEVANLRRHKAKTSAQRRHRSPPGKEHLSLRGWNLFLTNVPASIWPPKALVAVYRLRWRIEIIFKTWKSHLGLHQLNCRTAVLLQLSVLTKLLFCALVCQMCDVLELHCAQGDHVSLLRLERILGQCACWFSALVLGISVSKWLQFSLAHHAFYDRRKDRQNYYQLLGERRNLSLTRMGQAATHPARCAGQRRGHPSTEHTLQRDGSANHAVSGGRHQRLPGRPKSSPGRNRSRLHRHAQGAVAIGQRNQMKQRLHPAPPPKCKRILVVDDHPLMREGVAQWIQRSPGLEICGQAESAAQALALAGKLKPDLVLADISLPGRNGLELIKDLAALQPGLPVLVLSMHEESLHAARALRAGARGYIMKRSGGDRVVQAIGEVLQGRIALSPEMATQLLEEYSGRCSRSGRTVLPNLTDREFEILQLFGKAKSNGEIARQLRLSPKTVETHRLNLMRKLKLKDAAELLRFALQYAEKEFSGLVDG